MKFYPIMDQELPNGTHIITLKTGHAMVPPVWTVVVTTDGLSDRVISPTGEIITPGPADGKIPADLWYMCSQVLS
jgi:hypothetical protein